MQESVFTLLPGQYLQYNPQQSLVGRERPRRNGKVFSVCGLWRIKGSYCQYTLPLISVRNAFSICRKSVHMGCGIKILPKCNFFKSHFVQCTLHCRLRVKAIWSIQCRLSSGAVVRTPNVHLVDLPWHSCTFR